jgi:hypothetical protein
MIAIILLVVFIVFGKRAIQSCNTLQDEINETFNDLDRLGSKIEIEMLMLLIVYAVFGYYEYKIADKHNWKHNIFWIVTIVVVCYCIYMCCLHLEDT